MTASLPIPLLANKFPGLVFLTHHHHRPTDMARTRPASCRYFPQRRQKEYVVQ